MSEQASSNGQDLCEQRGWKDAEDGGRLAEEAFGLMQGRSRLSSDHVLASIAQLVQCDAVCSYGDAIVTMYDAALSRLLL